MALARSTIDEFIQQPHTIANATQDELLSLDHAEYRRLQLGALQTRFGELRERLAALTKLASSLSISSINSIETAAPLLFQHVIYKSYPLALLERSDFLRLTKWLGGLTTHNLSHLDVSHIRFIDDWLRYLDDHTPLRVAHSTGTSGKLSFMPRSTVELPAYVKGFLSSVAPFREEVGLEPSAELTIVNPAPRRGYGGGPRILQAIIDELKISEKDILTLDETKSADLMSLAGRLRSAEAKGELTNLGMNAHMEELRSRLLEYKAQEGTTLSAYFERLLQFKGRKVWIQATYPQLYRAAREAAAKGVSDIFDPRSVVTSGGGFKGEALPENYREVICKFLGVPTVREAYGMTEMNTLIPRCPDGGYHIPPQVIPYVIDPDGGELLPQTGLQTGRFGFVDLLAQTYWGGFLSGDKVTIDWDTQCKCGRTGGPMIVGTISRYSEERGGDDKISCAGGADEAHESAVRFLLEQR
jgi:hypothetical protein